MDPSRFRARQPPDRFGDRSESDFSEDRIPISSEFVSKVSESAADRLLRARQDELRIELLKIKKNLYFAKKINFN